MNKAIKTSAAVAALVGVIAAGYFIRQRVKQDQKNSAGQGAQEEIISTTAKTYTHPSYGFSFDYPDNFTLGNFPEDNGETILVQGKDGKSGFQIFVSPYNEPEELSLAVIKKSAGELVAKNEKEITIGSQGSALDRERLNLIQAFSFTLENPAADAGDPTAATNEVWFTQDGNLYQITSYEGFGDEMGKILESWRFN